jgi:hypothetical protein
MLPLGEGASAYPTPRSAGVGGSLGGVPRLPPFLSDDVDSGGSSSQIAGVTIFCQASAHRSHDRDRMAHGYSILVDR